MSSSQHLSAFTRSRLTAHPRNADSLASFRDTSAEGEACPNMPYVNPAGVWDVAPQAPICPQQPGALGSVDMATETLYGGPSNPQGLVKSGILKNNLLNVSTSGPFMW